MKYRSIPSNLLIIPRKGIVDTDKLNMLLELGLKFTGTLHGAAIFEDYYDGLYPEQREANIKSLLKSKK